MKSPTLFTDSDQPNAKRKAQTALEGITHYVDDGNLYFHRARIISARPVMQGRAFAIVESVSLDWNHTRRGFRFAIFAIDGHCIERPKLEDSYTTSKAATKAMWDALNAMDAETVFFDAITRMDKAASEYRAELKTFAKEARKSFA